MIQIYKRGSASVGLALMLSSYAVLLALLLYLGR